MKDDGYFSVSRMRIGDHLHRNQIASMKSLRDFQIRRLVLVHLFLISPPFTVLTASTIQHTYRQDGLFAIQRLGTGPHVQSHREEAGVSFYLVSGFGNSYTLVRLASGCPHNQARFLEGNTLSSADDQMQDFMRLYSGLVEKCFNACTQDFTSKALTNNEVSFGYVLFSRYTAYKRERGRRQMGKRHVKETDNTLENMCRELHGQILEALGAGRCKVCGT